MIDPGKMDQRITFQVATATPDGAGGSTLAWGNIATTPTVWAHVRGNTGRELMEQERMNATATTSFWIRNRDDIDERNAILWQGERYNIRHILRQGGRELYVKIVAERGVANAGAV